MNRLCIIILGSDLLLEFGFRLMNEYFCVTKFSFLRKPNVRRPQGEESIIQIDGIHIMCGTVWKCSTECGLSMQSNWILLM